MTTIARNVLIKTPTHAMPLTGQTATDQDITVSGFGDPVGLILVHPWTLNHASTNSGAQFCIGFTDGTNERAVAISVTDAIPLNNGREMNRKTSADRIIFSLRDHPSDANVEGDELRGNFKEFITDGARITHTIMHISGIHQIATLFGGTETSCEVGDVDTSAGDDTISGDWNFLLFISGHQDEDFDNTWSQDYAVINIGVAVRRPDGSVLQRGRTLSLRHPDSSNTLVISRTEDSDISTVILGGLKGQQRIINWTDSGLTVDRRRVTQPGYKSAYFALRTSPDVQMDLEDILTTTSTGTHDVDFDKIKAKPDWGMALSMYTTAANWNLQRTGNTEDNATLGWGVFDSTGEDYSGSIQDQDNQGDPSGGPPTGGENSRTRASAGIIHQHKADAETDGGDQLVGIVDSLNPAQVVIDFTTVDSSAVLKMPMVVMTEKFVTGSGTGVLPSLGASGTGVVTVTGSGTGVLPSLGANGTGAVTVTGSGTGVLPSLSATGAGTVTVTGSGTGVLPGLQATGTGVLKVSGSGTGVLPRLGANGTGQLTVTGSGTGVLPGLGANGSGIVIDGILMKKLISDAIVGAALVGEFLEVTYEMNTRKLIQGSTVTPASVECDEISSSFGDARNKRSLTHDRSGWIWELLVGFNVKVAAERFEERLTHTPIIIAQDIPNGIDQQIIIRLMSTTYQHSPRGGASNGSELLFRFSADLCPR